MKTPPEPRPLKPSPTKPIDLPFVFCFWLDAVTDAGWEDDHISDGPDEVWSSGWLLERTRKAITLASDVGVVGQHNRRITIPAGMIQRIHQGSREGPVVYSRKVKARPVPADK